MKTKLVLAVGIALVSFNVSASVITPLDKASFTLALAIPDSSTKLKFDNNSSNTPIDVDKDLGLTTSNLVASLGATWRPWDNHQFSFTYYNDSNSKTKSLDNPVEWNGVVYDGTVKAKTNVTTYDVSYIWWAFNKENWAFGPRVGLVYYDLGFDINLTLDADGDPVLGNSFKQSATPAIPAPTLGAAWRWTPGENWRIKMDAGYFSASAGDFDGAISFIGGGVEWFPHENWGVSLNLVRQNIDVNAEKAGLNGDLDFTQTNASLGVTYRW